MKITILLAFAAAFAAMTPSSLRAADDLHVMYEEGRAAFAAGQYDLARERLSYVSSKAPGHLPTQAMLVQIERILGPDNTVLRKAYAGVILDRVEFADVTLEESLQALRMLSMKASQNKVIPNVIIKSPELGKKPVTLSLAKVPLSEALNYLAQLSGAKLIYDKNAVVITSLADVTPPPTTPPVIPSTTAPATTHQALDRKSLSDPFARKS